MELNGFSEKVTNLSVKRLREMLNKRSPSSFQVFQIGKRSAVSNLRCKEKKGHSPKMVLKRYK